MRRLAPFLAATALIVPPALAAQQGSALSRAAATITEADVKRKIFVIADDSMKGRDTPSRGLDMTAQYVADQFKKAGLRPGAQDGTWFQHYLIRKTRIDLKASHLVFSLNDSRQAVDFSRDAFYREGPVPKGEVGGTAVVIGGALDPVALGKVELAGKTAVLILDYSRPRPAAVRPALDTLMARAAAVVIVTNRDTAQLAQIIGQADRVSVDRLSPEREGTSAAPVVEVHERAIGSLLTLIAMNPAMIRSDTTMVVHPAPSLKIMVVVRQEVLEEAEAPNTIGILEGSDPLLKHEYLVFSAHMDHVGVAGPNGTGGCQAVGADSICNGADDDGSGTVGVTELAKAFGQPGARPRRSVIFMTVSGEEKGLWGSEFFSEHPVVPLKQVVADLNIDMIGRNWKDTIVAIGKEHSDLGATLNRVNAQHPELHMTAIDDRWPEENFYFRSDHFNFARKGVPILFFFNGVHADYHQVSDSPDKLEAEKEARILRLLFYLGEEVANGRERPRWNPASYKKIVAGAQ